MSDLTAVQFYCASFYSISVKLKFQGFTNGKQIENCEDTWYSFDRGTESLSNFRLKNVTNFDNSSNVNFVSFLLTRFCAQGKKNFAKELSRAYHSFKWEDCIRISFRSKQHFYTNVSLCLCVCVLLLPVQPIVWACSSHWCNSSTLHIECVRIYVKCKYWRFWKKSKTKRDHPHSISIVSPWANGFRWCWAMRWYILWVPSIYKYIHFWPNANDDENDGHGNVHPSPKQWWPMNRVKGQKRKSDSHNFAFKMTYMSVLYATVSV